MDKYKELLIEVEDYLSLQGDSIMRGSLLHKTIREALIIKTPESPKLPIEDKK
jgi:hypothetical protein